MSLRTWFHSRWESSLRWQPSNNRLLGCVARVTMYGDWNAYTSDYLGTFPTRAAAMRAVTSATDPKKGYFL